MLKQLIFVRAATAVALAITAGLSDALDDGGFLATMVAAVIISVIAAVLGFVGVRLFEEPSVQEA